jgi:hypothetical protein
MACLLLYSDRTLKVGSETIEKALLSFIVPDVQVVLPAAGMMLLLMIPTMARYVSRVTPPLRATE